MGTSTGELEEPEKPAPESSWTQKEHEKDAALWDQMVRKQLGSAYALVSHVVLWQMRLSVYAKAIHVKGPTACIHRVQTAISATGVGGFMGNKGGLVVKLDFGNTSLVFVSSHLAAHSHKLEQRNQNCQEILRETQKSLGTSRLDFVSQFDHCFWMGDLNYRVDLNSVAPRSLGAPPPHGEGETPEHVNAVLELVEKGDYDTLYRADQLRACRERGEAFSGFTEAYPTFAPTFKVKRSVGVGAASDYKTQRVPSYTDRVLWKSMPPLASCVRNHSFRSLLKVSTSDHKPVVATFTVTPTESVFASVSRENSHGRRSNTDIIARTSSRRHSPRPLSLPRAGTSGLKSLLPLVRLHELEVVGIKHADLGGGSDPYCIFFSNPKELFASDNRAPTTTIKHAKRGSLMDSAMGVLQGSGGSGAGQGGIDVSLVTPQVGGQPLERPPDQPKSPFASASAASSLSNGFGGGRGSEVIEWRTEELPLLRPRLGDASHLAHCTMIVAIYDHDVVGEDDLLGVAMVPLAPPAAPPGGSSAGNGAAGGFPEEYEINVDQPITIGNESTGLGAIRMRLTVSHGSHLRAALQEAVEAKAGSMASHLAESKTCCELM